MLDFLDYYFDLLTYLDQRKQRLQSFKQDMQQRGVRMLATAGVDDLIDIRLVVLRGPIYKGMEILLRKRASSSPQTQNTYAVGKFQYNHAGWAGWIWTGKPKITQWRHKRQS